VALRFFHDPRGAPRTWKGNRLYRYYVSQDVLKRGREACPVGRVLAADIEAAVIDQLRGIFRQPEIIVGTWRAARPEQDDITEANSACQELKHWIARVEEDEENARQEVLSLKVQVMNLLHEIEAFPVDSAWRAERFAPRRGRIT
jgi:hypothetical protein